MYVNQRDDEGAMVSAKHWLGCGGGVTVRG
jgi:hypothetical protein